MEKEREEIRDAIERIKKNLKDEFMSGVFLQAFNMPNIEEFERRIRLIENSNYNPDLARELLDMDINFFLSLCLIYLKTIIRQLLRVQKSEF